jgi:acetyl-CoA C-acetyltransferase
MNAPQHTFLATASSIRPMIEIRALARTPFGRFGGALRDVDVRDLAAAAIGQTLQRGNLDPNEVDEVAIGVNFPGSRRSIGRQAALRAGVPATVNAFTVDRACCSSLTAVRLAARALRCGDAHTVVAGGAENLSAVPYYVESLRFGQRLGPVVLDDQLVVSCPHTGVARAVQASEEAESHGISRAEQDGWAVRSHELYWQAFEAARFDEIFPVDGDTLRGAGSLGADEAPRRNVTSEALAALPLVNGSTTVTAGNAPGLSTGAAALLLTSDRASAWGPPVAQIIGFGTASGEPAHIGATPAVAARAALADAGVKLDDVHVIEINEAFAAVPLVATMVLAGGDRARAEELRTRTNTRGGAIAIGHPTGASGARLVMSAIAALRARGGGVGLVAICGGVAEAEALVVTV